MGNPKLKLMLIVLLGVAFIASNCTVPPSPVPPAPTQPLVTESNPVLPKLAGFRVGVQAGHGRGDQGASSCDGTVHEADITAAVAGKVVDLLRRQGAQVDLFVGRDPGLSGYHADAFVALHTDYCPDRANPSSPSGYKVARYGGTPGSGLNGSGDPSDRLVQALWDEYGRATGLPQDRSPGHFTPGMLRNYALGQISGSTPGAIIEMGWLSGDLNVLVNEQDRLAAGIANGIVRFLAAGTPSQAAQSATVLLVDVSGSMSDAWRGGVKIESAKRAATDVINMIEQESQLGASNQQVAIATFTTNAHLDLGLTTDYDAARQVVNGLVPLDRTNIGAGLQVANQALTSAPAGAQKIIILLSDGLTNEGLSPGEILAGPVQETAAAGTCIYTVGFGEPGELDEELLRDIAAGAACGEYQYASAPDELERVYIRLRHQSLGTVLAQFEGQIAQGETKDVGQVEVPRNQGELYATLHWPGSKLDLIVTDPQGRRVDENYPGVSLVEYERLVYLIIQNPIPGMWLLQALGADVPEGILDYHAIVSVRERVGPPPTNVGVILLVLGLAALVGLVVMFIVTQQQRPRLAPATVQVVSGQAVRPFVVLRRRQLTIGRDPRCGMVLPDPQVSARHATIQQTPQGYVLTDLGSKNGTFVNDRRVQQVLLRGGEHLRVGQTELVFTAAGMLVAPAPVTPQPPVSTMTAYLAVMAGDQEFARYPVASGTVLGRYAGCQVDLSADQLVSRQHARLDCQAGQWIITDLDSGNHTFVNGRQVTSQALRHGDEVRVGNTRMRFYIQ